MSIQINKLIKFYKVIAIILLVQLLLFTGKAQAETDYNVGCYYFPGFFDAYRWAPMKEYGKPNPLLGYYNDGLPEMFYWHNKWASESGINFWIFDWYYDITTNQLSLPQPALSEGFLNSTNCNVMDFCIHWCNEALEGTDYTDQRLLDFADFLGDNYFSKPNYLRINNRPVVFISKPKKMLVSNFGSLQTQMAQAAGLPVGTNIYWVANCRSDDNAATFTQYANIGFAAISAYNYPPRNVPAEQLYHTYDAAIDDYQWYWNTFSNATTLPYIVPLLPGFDSRPWKGNEARVFTGSTPAKFQDMCSRSLNYIDPNLQMVIVEAWNEFGEGSYIEPTEEFGFDYLDALATALGVTPPIRYMPTPAERATINWDWIPCDMPQNRLLVPDSFIEWETFTGGAVTYNYNSNYIYSGTNSAAVSTGTGIKTLSKTRIEYNEKINISAYVKMGAAGGTATVLAALFDINGNWLGTYAPIGTTSNTDWTKVSGVYENTDPAVCWIDAEVVSANQTAYVDDVAIGSIDPNRLLDPDMENSLEWETLTGGAVSYSTSSPNSLKYCISIPAGSGIKPSELISVAPGETLRVGCYVKCATGGSAKVYSTLFDANGNSLGRTYLIGQTSSTSWTPVFTNYRNDATDVAKVNIEVAASGSTVYADSASATPGNLLPDIESGVEWVTVGGVMADFVSTQPHSGTYCIKVPAGGAVTKARETVPVHSEETLTLSAYVKASPGATARVFAAVFYDDGTNAGFEYFTVGQTSSPNWTLVSAVYRNDIKGAYKMSFEVNAVGGDCWIDDANIIKGNRLPDPGLESSSHWVTYTGTPATRISYMARGNYCLYADAGTGVKPVPGSQASVTPGEVVTLSGNVLCENGADAELRAALFDVNGSLLRYIVIGQWSDDDEDPPTWKKLSKNYTVESDVRKIGIEAYASAPPSANDPYMLVDDVAVAPGGSDPAPTTMFYDNMANNYPTSNWQSFSGSPIYSFSSLPVDTGGAKLTSLLTTPKSREVTVSARIKTNSSTTIGCLLSKFDANQNWIFKDYKDYIDIGNYISDDWTSIEQHVTLPADAVYFKVEFVTIGGTAYIDDVKVTNP